MYSISFRLSNTQVPRYPILYDGGILVPMHPHFLLIRRENVVNDAEKKYFDHFQVNYAQKSSCICNEFFLAHHIINETLK